MGRCIYKIHISQGLLCLGWRCDSQSHWVDGCDPSLGKEDVKDVSERRVPGIKMRAQCSETRILLGNVGVPSLRQQWKRRLVELKRGLELDGGVGSVTAWSGERHNVVALEWHPTHLEGRRCGQGPQDQEPFPSADTVSSIFWGQELWQERIFLEFFLFLLLLLKFQEANSCILIFHGWKHRMFSN